MLENKRDIALYIHIPFCKAKCFYCDFNSFACMYEYVPAYFDALKNEAAMYSSKLKDYNIKTVFIGGGTPSSVDQRYIYELLNLCGRNFNIHNKAEISIETNPGTLTYEKLAAYKASGINRISIGLQAWQNRLLKKIGRIHTNNEFVDNFSNARKAGFKNINIDLIFGLPSQSIKDWNETISHIIDFKPEHLSCYSLKIEQNTVFGDMRESGKLNAAGDELDREMHDLALARLLDAGYEHYEISNFAKQGCRCKHNMVYWKAQEYIGLGAGAHSYFEGKRFNNLYTIEEYITCINQNKIPSENIEHISFEEEMSEYMMLCFRLVDGIQIDEFNSRFGRDIYHIYGEQIHRLEKRLLVKADDRNIRLTSKGLDLANEVFMEFV